jgi:Flp pilus assembly protein TadD
MSNEDALALEDRGIDEFHAGDFARAADSFAAAAALAPDERGPHYNLGIACLKEGDRIGGFAIDAGDVRVVSANDAWYRRAIDAFTRALAIEPTHQPSLVMRGHAHKKRLDDANARADWTAAETLGEPNAARLLASLG